MLVLPVCVIAAFATVAISGDTKTPGLRGVSLLQTAGKGPSLADRELQRIQLEENLGHQPDASKEADANEERLDWDEGDETIRKAREDEEYSLAQTGKKHSKEPHVRIKSQIGQHHKKTRPDAAHVSVPNSTIFTFHHNQKDQSDDSEDERDSDVDEDELKEEARSVDEDDVDEEEEDFTDSTEKASDEYEAAQKADEKEEDENEKAEDEKVDAEDSFLQVDKASQKHPSLAEQERERIETEQMLGHQHDSDVSGGGDEERLSWDEGDNDVNNMREEEEYSLTQRHIK